MLVDHPLLRGLDRLETLLAQTAESDPAFLPAEDKQAALEKLTRLHSRLTALTLRVVAAADDVAALQAHRDIAAWLAHHTRTDRGTARHTQTLAHALDHRWTRVGTALAHARVNPDQAAVIVAAMDALPDDLDPHLVTKAEAHLVEQATHFGPAQLKKLGRRVLEVVAPDIAEAQERKALEDEERTAEKKTSLRFRPHGDGTTTITIRLADAAAHRLSTVLDAYTSPRQADARNQWEHGAPLDVRRGHAFTALLEHLDPARLPLHGGDATTVIVTIDHDTLIDQLTKAGLATLDGQPITAAHARRLACTATILPAVLGGDSQILDLGRTRRLYSPAQRKAMAIRDHTCRAHGCTIPATWCEAHHLTPWSRGGRTDLDDGLLLCTWHHHRAHDPSYHHDRMPDGSLRFHRRT